MQREDFSKYFLPTYNPWHFVPKRAKGVMLWDTNNKRYLDLGGGIAVTSLGHCNDDLIATLTHQAQQLWHVSNYMTNIPALQLAKNLCTHSFAEQVFLTNSGVEANEAALKLARKYANTHFGDSKHKILACKSAFHGRSLFTVNVGGTKAYKTGFGPAVEGIEHIDIFQATDAELAHAIDAQTCAVILEPILGEAGVLEIPKARLTYIQALCKKHHALLILDEIQTGAGRTGALFYHQILGIVPDIVTAAKGLGGGIPIGAMLTTKAIGRCFTVGTHGSTFGGNPLATAVANRVLETIVQSAVQDNTSARCMQIKQALQANSAYNKLFMPVRGQGLLLGLPLKEEYKAQAANCMHIFIENGLLLMPAAGGMVFRIAPSLLITAAEITQALDLLNRSCEQILTAQKH